MLTRIVRMEFKPEKIAAFQALFHQIQPKIAQFPGCTGVDLLQDLELPHVYYTLSTWESSRALETYRSSDFFAQVWPLTKTYFSGKPQAYSLVPPIKNRK